MIDNHDILVIDFETRWDSKEYTLSKMTTEEYVRDERFKAFGLGVKPYGESKSIWIPHHKIEKFVSRIDWSRTALLAHNAQFDVAILAWHYGVKPAFIYDSLSMARALRGVEIGNSLSKLAGVYGLPAKGKAVHNTNGLTELTPDIEKELADYCLHDVFLCEEIFNRLYHEVEGNYPEDELRLIDLTLRMFTEPVLELDGELLKDAIEDERTQREELLAQLDINEKALASNDKFAEVLRSLGVEPPTKVSKTTGKTAFAFAKNDALFQALLNSSDDRVVAACEARLKVKSTLERTRAQRFLDIAQRGTLPVPLNYYGAHTGRWAASRGSNLNLQNLKRKSFLRKAICAPEGTQLVVCDLSQIEPRVLAYIAGDQDLLDIFSSGQDPYAAFGAQMFGIPDLSKETHPDLRQSAKSALLGAGYGMGWASFAAQLLTGFLGAPPVRYDRAFAKTLGIKSNDIRDFLGWEKNIEKLLEIPHTCTDEELLVHAVCAKKIIDKYRAAAAPVVDFWSLCNELIVHSLVKGKPYKHGCLTFDKERIILPSGMALKYPALRPIEDERGRVQWVYGENAKRLYGGKLVENCIAQDTEVLTARGWVPIQLVRTSDRVHDGVEFVQHGGLVYKSVQGCVSIDGVWMTPDHEVLTDYGWQTASQNPEPYRPDLRHVDCAQPRTQRWEEKIVAVSLSVWRALCEGWSGRNQGDKARRDTELRVYDKGAHSQRQHQARYVQAPSVCGVAQYVGSLSATHTSSVEELWRAWYQGLSTMAGVVREFLGRHGCGLPTWFGLRPNRQQWGLHPRELSLDRQANQHEEQAQQSSHRHTHTKQTNRDTAFDSVLPAQAQPVFDIINAGSRQRFVVRGDTAPFVVHNCVQGVARCVMTDGMLRIQERYPVKLTVHDEAVVVVPDESAEEAREWIHAQMIADPPYMTGIPLEAESDCAIRYGEAK